MAKSKYGNSNLYMTTEEFASMVIDALHEQNYFKKDETAHPYDIATAFSSVGETIGIAMQWAIKQENQAAKKEKIKNTIMETKDLRKVTLPIDEEIAPSINDYSEWKFNK